MKTFLFLFLAAGLTWSCAQTPTAPAAPFQLNKVPLLGGPCENCEGIFDLSQAPGWTDTLPAFSEEGEPMVISGVIYQADGRTPAPGVILYVYHTNARGIYPKRPGNGDDGFHGYIRGWMRTDSQGRYRFYSIRPGSYPNSRAAQHIHPLILEPGKGYYWIDEFVFADDPFLSEEARNPRQPRGGSGVVALKKNQQGQWEGRRNITLGFNVPAYSDN